jgi:hypothetical protein
MKRLRARSFCCVLEPVHWVKVRVDPRSTGVFSIEQQIVRSNL